MPEDMMLPRYQCHKKVWALKIAAIEFEDHGDARIAPKDAKYATFEVADYRIKFKGNEKDLGYFIQYEDGYKSWSPSDVFEAGYTKI